ncbi:MAG: hypothetical protein FJ319_05940 [SAR202 cluster bacterium]|nr:hypothetical protein [SAR202 cluster bacterium]
MALSTARKPFLKYSFTLGIAAMEGRGFYYPTDLAFRNDGRIYVLGRGHDGDTRGVQVLACNIDSEYFGKFASHGKGPGQFIWSTAIACDNAGNIYVADEYLNNISIFSPDHKFITRWGEQGTEPGKLNGPCGLSFDWEGNLFVVDHQNNRIQKFTKDGALLQCFGHEGLNYGEFNLPWGICVPRYGDIYVADWGNDRIQQFAPNGTYIASYGRSGDGDGEFNRPSSIAVDAQGYMYVTDWGNHRVQVLDPEGRFVQSLRGQATASKWAEEFFQSSYDEGRARAQSNLEPDLSPYSGDPYEESWHMEKYFWAPVSVKVDSAGRVLVVERNRHRIQVYERAK